MMRAVVALPFLLLLCGCSHAYYVPQLYRTVQWTPEITFRLDAIEYHGSRWIDPRDGSRATIWAAPAGHRIVVARFFVVICGPANAHMDWDNFHLEGSDGRTYNILPQDASGSLIVTGTTGGQRPGPLSTAVVFALPDGIHVRYVFYDHLRFTE